MLHRWIAHVALIGIPQVLCTKIVPRTDTTIPSVTSVGSSSSLSTPECCYISEKGVIQNIWYTGSIEVTVATVSTVVYKYNNTAITSRTTIKANSTSSFATGTKDGLRIPGIPTDLVGSSLGLYPDGTSMVYGTELTDAYGVVYASPTPVWSYGWVDYSSYTATLANGAYQCPRSPNSGDPKRGEIRPYPSGYFETTDPQKVKPSGQLWIPSLPDGLRNWIKSHKPPAMTGTSMFWADITNCTMGYGEGIPVAHIPVTELTAQALTTMTMTGYYGNPAGITAPAAPGPSPVSQGTIQTPSPHNSPGGTSAGKPLVGQDTTLGLGNTPDGKTTAVQQGKNPLSTIAPGTTPFIIVAGSTYFANSASGFVIGGQSLTRGGVVTEAGETISMAADGSSIVVVQGTHTMTEGLGTIIASQGGVATNSPSGYEGPLASSAGSEYRLDARVMSAVLGMAIMAVCV